MINKRYIWFLIFGILAGLTKEQVWFIVGLMALYAGIKNKKYIFGVAIFLIMTGISYYLIAVAIPAALGSQHFALSYYSDFGDKPSTVIKTILLSPGKTFSLILSPSRLHYLVQIFSPLGFLSLLAPIFIVLSLPELFIYLLSNNPNLYQIYYQYTATITPFLIIAAIYGSANILRWLPKIGSKTFAIILIIICLFTAYLFGPLPRSVEANLDMFTKPVPDSNSIDHFLAIIPRHYSVSAMVSRRSFVGKTKLLHYSSRN